MLKPNFPRRSAGFTLIEVLVAVAIVGVLAAVAMPAYFESVRKSRRSEAMAALSAVLQAQERWRANQATYTADFAANLKVPSSTNYYSLAITNPSAGGYTVTATAVSGSPQDKDENCHAMRVRLAGGNISYGSACKTCTMASPLTDPNRCWSRQ